MFVFFIVLALDFFNQASLPKNWINYAISGIIHLRQLLQGKRDEVTKETNEFKSDYGKLMSGITKMVTNGKNEHQKLTNLVRLICFHSKINLYID